MIDIARELGAKTIVWGSPKHRKLEGKSYPEAVFIVLFLVTLILKLEGKSYAEAFEIAKSFFTELGLYAAGKGVIIAMEVNG